MKKTSIKYYSTNHKAPEVSFREALLKGLAPDGGLYMPSVIPRINSDLLQTFRSKEYYEIAADVLGLYLKDEIETNIIRELCRDAYTFPVPVEKVDDGNYILRLDQGPTASFKDFAARMMARLMNHFLADEKKRFTILTATSGDTGSAVASAFHNLPRSVGGLKNIDVIILFPFREVSEIQRRQMTTLKGNIKVLAVDGKFDDCQQLVKRAFSDPELAFTSLSSANSINIGRLLPQSVYYFYAWSRLAPKGTEKAVFSVPSGNYGNLMGGILAREMGLPVKRFIIATNSNSEVPDFLKSGVYKIISPSINCISNAMNVGHPSNLARIISLYGGEMNEQGTILKGPDLEGMRHDFTGISVTDEETRETISGCYTSHGIILEPHGAVAWKGTEFYREEEGYARQDDIFISLETAHPAKFSDEINRLLGFSPQLPPSLKGINDLTEEYSELNNDYSEFKRYILKHIN